MQDLAGGKPLSSRARQAKPILHQASIAADEAAAERIARALEETFHPSPVAVGVFDLGKGRFEVFAHFVDTPPRDTLLALIEHAADGAQLGPLSIE
jgi:hypothetical protein